MESKAPLKEQKRNKKSNKNKNKKNHLRQFLTKGREKSFSSSDLTIHFKIKLVLFFLCRNEPVSILMISANILNVITHF